jgi:hypothetical protein
MDLPPPPLPSKVDIIKATTFRKEGDFDAKVKALIGERRSGATA